MDGALRAGRTTRQEIDELLGRMRHTPGLSTARAALDLADGLAESPGESRLRVLLTRLGIEFVAQHWVRTSAGRHYRVDFYLPALGVVLEYDGRVKYAGDAAGLDGDRSGQEALLAEKRREDDLRLDGFGVGRVTASGLTARAVRQTVSAAGRQAQPSAVGRASEPPPWAGRA
jgi:very-short-patch-repair endonuclease